ncbi:MAG: DUF460 domain-containing protein [Sulfolobales archaeon]
MSEKRESSEELVVAGLDLFRGSVLSREGAYYSISIMSRDRILYEGEDLSLPKVLRILHEYKPRYIVLDNLYELAHDQKSLNRILSLLPPSSEIILATYDPVSGYVDLRTVASKLGVYESKRKPDSLSTARILAKIGLLGVGFKIKVWEEKVRITVSRNRSSRAGGSSEDRFKRASRAYVLRIAKKIRDALDRNGFSYEMLIRRSSGGIERAVFIVNTSIDKLSGIVKPMKGRYVRVTIRPVSRTVLNIPQETFSRKNPIIVGIDPGISYGIAIVDLNGVIQATYTVAGGDLGEIIPRITKHGTPIVVASDIRPAPESVRRIASIFGARLYEPEYIPSDSEKEELIKDLGYKPSTIHERDALFSAMLFYRKMVPKLQQIDRIIKDLNIRIDPLKVKSEVIRGVDLASAIEGIFREILQSEDARSELIVRDFVKEIMTTSARLKKLEEEYQKLLMENKRLKEKISELNRYSLSLQSELESIKRDLRSDVMRDREVSMLSDRLKICLNSVRDLEEVIEGLKGDISKLKNLILEAVEGAYIALKIYREPRDLLNSFKELPLIRYRDRSIRIGLLDFDISSELIREVYEVSGRNSVLIISTHKCESQSLGDETYHVICVNIPAEDVILRIGDKLIIRRDSFERILELYERVRKMLPSRIIRSEDELARLLDEYKIMRAREREYKT